MTAQPTTPQPGAGSPRPRVLITGATGFIGGRLAQRLATETDYPVRGLARSPEKGRWLADLGVEIVQGDITDPASVQAAMEGCGIVYHSAAWVQETGSREEVWAVNVQGTANVVEAALAAGVRRFIHVSSCGVYGSLQRLDIDESTPPRRSGDLYRDSKLEAEEVVLRAIQERGLPAVIVRPSQVYGPGSPQFTVRPVKAIQEGKMILVDGGRHLVKPVYIDNLVDALILCGEVEGIEGEILNITDGYTVTWAEFFGAYARMLGVEKLPSVPYPVAWLVALLNEIRAGLQGKKATLNRKVLTTLRSRNSFSNRKARELLGWEPRVDFQEGMRRCEEWLRAEGYLGR